MYLDVHCEKKREFLTHNPSEENQIYMLFYISTLICFRSQDTKEGFSLHENLFCSLILELIWKHHR